MALNFPKNKPDGEIWFEPSNRVTYVYNRIKNSWTGVGIYAQDPSIEEAPNDNRMYARKDEGWSDVEKEFDFDILFTHSVAGRKYTETRIIGDTRREGVEEAPTDGLMYFRNESRWIQLERNMDIRALPDLGTITRNVTPRAGLTIDEAPNDGRNYCRKNLDWVILEQEFDVDQYQEVS